MVVGRKIFQVKFISWSYRIRGRVARAHKNKRIKIKVFTHISKSRLKIQKEDAPKNNKAESILIKRIFKYSAIKRKANLVPPYSTLKPETSSDSPSAKSKGARLVSARVVINQRIRVGNIRKAIHIGGFIKEFIIKVDMNRRGIKIIRAMETS